MSQKIPTQVLPGFMELTPADQIAFDAMKAAISHVFELFGFVPVDTPAIERAEVLLAKAGGETEKQIYRFNKGDNDLALRFDLTVPLARYVSEHFNELTFPFRRYQIAKVYRGESPQKGRYREFYQCDIDIIGNGALPLVNDAEIPSVIYAVFKKLDFGPFVIRLSNRKLITGLLASLDASEKAVEVMRAIDKVEKIGKAGVTEMLAEAGLSKTAVAGIFKFLDIKGTTDEVLASVKNLSIKNTTFTAGIEELTEVVRRLKEFQVPDEFFAIDLSIARGLDYYTGTVYETTLTRYPQAGSVCSGGRYDNLAEKYTSRTLPGVGISIGLTRLFSQLKEAGVIKIGPATVTKVLVVPLVADMAVPLKLATMLRAANIPTEIYFDDAKMKTKLGLADKLGIPYTLLVGEDEIAAGKFTLKNMASGEQSALAPEEILKHLVSKL